MLWGTTSKKWCLEHYSLDFPVVGNSFPRIVWTPKGCPQTPGMCAWERLFLPLLCFQDNRAARQTRMGFICFNLPLPFLLSSRSSTAESFFTFRGVFFARALTANSKKSPILVIFWPLDHYWQKTMKSGFFPCSPPGPQQVLLGCQADVTPKLP